MTDYDSKKAVWGFCDINHLTKRTRHNHILCECPRCIPLDYGLGYYMCAFEPNKYVVRSQVKEQEIKET